MRVCSVWPRLAAGLRHRHVRDVTVRLDAVRCVRCCFMLFGVRSIRRRVRRALRAWLLPAATTATVHAECGLQSAATIATTAAHTTAAGRRADVYARYNNRDIRCGWLPDEPRTSYRRADGASHSHLQRRLHRRHRNRRGHTGIVRTDRSGCRRCDHRKPPGPRNGWPRLGQCDAWRACAKRHAADCTDGAALLATAAAAARAKPAATTSANATRAITTTATTAKPVAAAATKPVAALSTSAAAGSRAKAAASTYTQPARAITAGAVASASASAQAAAAGYICLASTYRHSVRWVERAGQYGRPHQLYPQRR